MAGKQKASWLFFYYFSVTGIHSMQGWTATTRHRATRKRSRKRWKEYRKACILSLFIAYVYKSLVKKSIIYWLILARTIICFSFLFFFGFLFLFFFFFWGGGGGVVSGYFHESAQILNMIYKSSRPKVFYKERVLKIFANFTGKYLC